MDRHRPSTRRPREGGDPYAVWSRLGSGAEAFRNNRRRGLWVPAFAGTTHVVAARASSPSLPRRDDLDLVAGFKPRLRPAAARQHVEIQRDRKMRAFVVELVEQRIDMRSRNLALLAIDGHAHCITSLSITPRST